MQSAKLDRLSPEHLRGNPRATLASWLKYETLVEAAYSQHPKPYIYHPATMSPTTVASRLRDAIRGAIAFDYSKSISTDDLRRWYSEIIIKHDETKVYIGTDEEVVSVLQGHKVQADLLYHYDSLSLDEIIAFTLLLASGRLVGPVIISSPPDISMLQQRDNVEVITRGDGSLHLI